MNKPNENAVRDNASKVDYTILPMEGLPEVVAVFEMGARKYARDNYKQGTGLPLENYRQSMFRHLVASTKGEKNDPESELDHVAHIVANGLMYLWQQQNENK